MDVFILEREDAKLKYIIILSSNFFSLISDIICNDTYFIVGTTNTQIDNCQILRSNFMSINITRQTFSGLGTIGEVNASTSVQSSSQFRGSVRLEADRVVFTFDEAECSDEGTYKLSVLDGEQIVFEATFNLDIQGLCIYILGKIS